MWSNQTAVPRRKSCNHRDSQRTHAQSLVPLFTWNKQKTGGQALEEHDSLASEAAGKKDQDGARDNGRSDFRGVSHGRRTLLIYDIISRVVLADNTRSGGGGLVLEREFLKVNKCKIQVNFNSFSCLFSLAQVSHLSLRSELENLLSSGHCKRYKWMSNVVSISCSFLALPSKPHKCRCSSAGCGVVQDRHR